MLKRAAFYTAEQLSGMDKIPSLYDTTGHLVYSSPATLAYNSPGAEGFGVKRAGLAIPGSIMLIVSPGCCGRNTSSITEIPGYQDRFFYLTMNETDLVTGRHLKRIPEAVVQIVNSLKKKPSVIMICITCVDALLGTDMERVARKAEEACGIPVRPCYMYALTREGRRPPMVQVRQSLYSLLKPRKKVSTSVNLMGYFAPLAPGCEIRNQLKNIGVKKIREISTCSDIEEFYEMAEANFNVVLNDEARPAAEDLSRRLGIPYIEMTRLYQIDQIEKQTLAFGKALGYEIRSPKKKAQAEESVRALKEQAPDLVFAVGESCNANPFELSLALVRYGFRVVEIFGTPSQKDRVYLDQLSELSPETKIYSNMNPSMIWFEDNKEIDVSVGKDAAFWHPDACHVDWNSDEQPYGYEGVKMLFDEIRQAVENHQNIHGDRAVDRKAEGKHSLILSDHAPVKGLRRVLTPFAPDQSGAEAVLFDMGGIITIIDAGGCTGNICGFDEPRWGKQRSAVFSAGLRDMDAIMGRDELLVKKAVNAQKEIQAPFVAFIGTPVPAVIGTDFHALARMTEKKTDVPVISIDTNGFDLYDKGEEKAYRMLFQTFAQEPEKKTDRIGIVGLTPLEVMAESDRDRILSVKNSTAYGCGASMEMIRKAGEVRENLAVSPAGVKACQYLQKKFGTPYRCFYPVDEVFLSSLPDLHGKRIMIIHQQVLADEVRKQIRKRYSDVHISVHSWFMMLDELKETEDTHLKEESDFITLAEEADVIIGDPVLKELIPDFQGVYIDLPHFAVSGRWKNE